MLTLQSCKFSKGLFPNDNIDGHIVVFVWSQYKIYMIVP